MTTALTDLQLQQLDELLLSDITPENTMDVEMLDGFLVNLAIGPGWPAESEWLPAVFGGELPTESTDATTLLNLIRQHASWIQQQWNPRRRESLAETEPLYLPLILEDDVTGKEGLGQWWATGFRAGTQLQEEQWESFLDENDDFYELIASIYALEFGHHPVREEEVLGIKERLERLDDLPWLVEDAFWMWREQELGTVETIRHEQAPPGRNDPCPCGSEKKYKKCCGLN